MFVNKLSLINFRNYEKASVEFSKGVNVIYGSNGTGKTNILEAVYFLSTARSHRQASNGEMIKFGADSAKITADFRLTDKNYKSEILLFADKKKRISINRIAVEKTSELMEYLKTVMFCPEDLRLVKGAPKDRRRMLDLGICQLKQNYFHALVEYTKILHQKSRLLKTGKNSETMWVWNEKLAKSGAAVIWYRKNYLDKLEKIAAEINFEISSEKMELFYMPGAAISDFDDKSIIYEQLVADINKNSHRELKLKIALTGPHRDDFKIKINDMEARFFASQGQQRTAAVSLKIAELEMIKNTFNETPVLLLDDVLSELDEKRRRYIMNKIQGVQVIITCTDADRFSGVNLIDVNNVQCTMYND